MKILGALVGLLSLFALVFLVLFLGGLASAALEVRAEKKAGKTPTRPAWENRAKRRAVGRIPLRERARSFWMSVRYPGVAFCWCRRGVLDDFPALDGRMVAGTGCTAWEAGDPVAMHRHDLAGGYQRVPKPEAVAA